MLAKPPKRELLVRGLLACGWTKNDKPKTNKFHPYLSPFGAQVALVGHAGALRMLKDGSQPISESVSLTGGTDYRAYCQVGDPKATYSGPEEARAALALAKDFIRRQKKSQA